MSDSKNLLWLDDERDPSDSQWQVYFPVSQPIVHWVKSFDEFVDWISKNGLPEAICFDHDLGVGLNGFDAAKWLTAYCLENRAVLPAWNIQSANPIGKCNIASLLNTFERAVQER